ncbi:MAG TPA: Bax inhibitor-1 family protein, partial [Phototrophicaceae bacterium]|nr:Bax inhibitor-1 family protein [Phototrophicaceae bacterium]
MFGRGFGSRNSQGLFAQRDTSALTSTEIRPLLKWTYVWMIVGLIVTAVVASSSVTINLAYTQPELFIVAIIAELVFVFALSLGISRMSPAIAAICFLIYSALNGFTLSLLVYAYTDASVAL